MRPTWTVKTGSTVLAENGFDRIAGRRIGFIGNHTSLLNDGVPTVSSMLAAGVCCVERLFAPEHGAFGTYDESVSDEADPLSGLTIHSLYGESRRPSPETMKGLEYLVLELQDVGARFYTYTATLLGAIDAAHESGARVLVLDRPNPIDGIHSEGPLADPDDYAFVAPYSIPIRHGLTLGEVGLLYAIETGKQDSIEVIPASGWVRSSFFDQTGLTWTSPSPAMVSLSTAILYPGVCLLEQTNVSVGRGTAAPFEIVGAPFVDGNRWAAALTEMNIVGASFTPTTFTPKISKYAGEECSGVKITVDDRTSLQSVSLGIALITSLRDLFGSEFEIAGSKRLLSNSTSFKMLIGGEKASTVADSWRESLKAWDNRRVNCLLY